MSNGLAICQLRMIKAKFGQVPIIFLKTLLGNLRRVVIQYLKYKEQLRTNLTIDFTWFKQKLINKKILPKINTFTEPKLKESLIYQKDKYHPSIVAIFSSILIFYMLNIEFYPLSKFAMFSGNNKNGKITYIKTIIHYYSGNSYEANYQKLFNSNYYTKSIKRCFLPREKNRCKLLLKSTININNNFKGNQNITIKALEVQQWTWNFLKYPQDKHYGQLMDKLIVENN